MATQNKLNVGDIITIKQHKRGRQHLLVVEAGRRISPARDGDYWVDEIACFEIENMFPKPGVQPRPPLLHRSDSSNKLHLFYFDSGCMSGAGKKINEKDVTVVGKTEVKKKVVTLYDYTAPTYYGNR